MESKKKKCSFAGGTKLTKLEKKKKETNNLYTLGDSARKSPDSKSFGVDK